MEGFGPTVEEVRKGLIGKIGENMSFRRFKRYSGGGQLVSYLHGVRIGVMVEFEGDAVAAKDTAMHIAAMKPVALTCRGACRSDRERALGGNRQGGRVGQTGRYRRQDDRRIGAEVPQGGVSVQPALRQERQADRRADAQGAGTTVKGFTMFVVGEGIEKKVDDFAAEVAAQVAAAKAPEYPASRVQHNGPQGPFVYLMATAGSEEGLATLEGCRYAPLHFMAGSQEPAGTIEPESSSHASVQAHIVEIVRRGPDGRRCLRHQPGHH
jgi:hypothetical protein